MSVETVRAYLEEFGAGDRIIELDQSSATVELAAAALGCEPERIAKTLSFYAEGNPLVVVAAGDAKVDNRKYRDVFGVKAKMIPFGEVEAAIGHAPGGVCPFAVAERVAVCLDESLKRFNTIFPAAGSDRSAVQVTISELEEYSRYHTWVDVCKSWQNND